MTEGPLPLRDENVLLAGVVEAISAGLSGSTRIAASPHASSSDGCEDTTHGAPHAIASTTGIPNPSNRDG